MDSTPSTTESTVVSILHGDDLLHMQRHIAGLVAKVSPDSALADMNITRIDMRQASEEDLRSAVGSMPFMASMRLVILTNPLAKAGTDAGRSRLKDLLSKVPDTTLLVLVIEDYIDRKDWKSLPQQSWLRKWVAGAGRRAEIVLCQLPAVGAMPEWVRKEAQRQGGQFMPEAARALVAHVSNDTRQASIEIDKLLTYVNRSRPVEPGDVEDLTTGGGEADVFKMVDEIAAGNARGATRLLRRLLEVDDPLRLFGMIVRQFRLLIQVREILDEGRGHMLAQELHLYDSQVKNLTGQARRFSMQDLEGIYHRLLEIDEAMKTSQMPQEMALETFILEMAR